MSQATASTTPAVPPARHLALTWDMGSAYDLFLSLLVLHDPDTYGLRPSWAAGVRSRLPAAERKLLEEINPFLWVPIHWINVLPEPKDAATALYVLRQIEPSERMFSLFDNKKLPDVGEILREIAERRAWSKIDQNAIKKIIEEHKSTELIKLLPQWLEWWTRPEEFGELFLSSLQTYFQAFFEEEERRITPVLRRGLEHAQKLSAKLPVPDLLAELSQGVHLDIPAEIRELILVPGYWNTPLILYSPMDETRMLLVFGVRPVDMALVPGENVPDGLLRALKALSDPTRLQIMRYLSEEELTQAQLARALRLRAPTVTHHLSVLRLAGLVHVNVNASDEKRYAARLQAVKSSFNHLQEFLRGAKDE